MGNGESKTWVLLAAGSKDWDNYRHQADVCHAYQIIHRSGIPDEQIVVMMYDDIAYNVENPKKGNIINVPNGPNVYEGVLKDYTGNDVSADNFLAVLRGDSVAVKTKGPKKVLKSGSNDTILIYLSDHGSTGMFSFPKSTLYATDLIDTVTEMSNNQQFSKMVIYMESCHSGSMLQGLPSSCNVYGISASTPEESSFACFFDEWRNAYLADEFSTFLFHHIKTHDLNRTTLERQFDFLKKKVKSSKPCQYGNMQIGQEYLCQFWGNDPAAGTKGEAYHIQVNDAIASHNVPLRIQANRIQRERDPRRKREHQRKYDELQRTTSKIERVVLEIQQRCTYRCASTSRRRAEQGFACMERTKLVGLKTVTEHFRTSCFDWHDERFGIALQHAHVFADLIYSGTEEYRIMEAITAVRGRLF
ncbi:legumain-like [Myxocyprinus asiaticus]|uniref:legumain-like n=1 Tax=Myxocyprinus asiaticus TaxID=70543 RepID=UPI002223B558|nr:legumain-like [Myxocyprinus asiaticus]